MSTDSTTETLGTVEQVREALNDVAEDADGTLIGNIPERVITRALTGARVHANRVAHPDATTAERRELVIATAALDVVGSDLLTKQKGAEGERITWDTANFHERLESKYERALKDAARSGQPVLRTVGGRARGHR